MMGDKRMSQGGELDFPYVKRMKAEEPVQPVEPVAVAVATDEDRQVLIGASMELLENIPYVEGSKIQKQLNSMYPDAVGRVKEGLEGKGWLKRLFEGEPGIVQIEVSGRNEPCFRLASCTLPMPRPPAPGVIIRPGTVIPPSGGKYQPSGAAETLAAAPAVQPTFQSMAQEGKGDWSVTMWGKGQAWTPEWSDPSAWGKGKGCMPGWDDASMWGKGQIWYPEWSAWTKGEAAWSKGDMDWSKGGAAWPKGGGPWSKGGMQTWGKGKGGKMGKAGVSPEVASKLIEAAVELLNTAERAVELGFLEGSLLVKKLTDVVPNEVEKMKAALGKKGWLGRLFEEDHRVQQVRVESKGEPCYALASKIPTLTFAGSE